MFVSREWSICAWAKKEDGRSSEERYKIMNELFWSSVAYSIKITKPLVHILRLVDGEMPAMGFNYNAMDEAKETLQKNFDGDVLQGDLEYSWWKVGETVTSWLAFN